MMVKVHKNNYSMLDYIPVGLCLVDREYKVLYWNRCMEVLTGVNKAGVIGTDVRDHFIQVKDNAYQSRLEGIFNGESPTIFSSSQHEHNFTLQMPAGDLRLQHVNITAVPTDDKKVYNALFAIEDVTEVNQKIEDYKVVRDEVLEELKHRRIMEEELIAYREHLEKMVKDRTRELSEANRQLHKEVAEKTKIEKELQRALDQNEKLLASISSILIGVDARNVITHWNASAESVFAIKAEEAIGTPFKKCTVQWNWETVKKCIRACRQNKKPHKLNEVRYVNADGKECFLNITVNPFIGNDHTTSPGFLILAEDITERKILEGHLAQAQKLESIGQLAAGIAHEINTPIQYVGDNTRFLKDSFGEIGRLFERCDFLNPKSACETVSSERLNALREMYSDADINYLMHEIPVAIEQTEDGVERVANIVRAMKDFSHPSAKEMTYLDINHAILTTITVARNEWKYVADLQTELSDELPPIACYPDEFNQVILNLITNAAHAIADKVGDSNDKGEIKIGTRKREDAVEITVEDSGNGIPEHVRSRIFDPFFTTKEVGKGTGQGLALAHNAIVERLGGTIHFETEVGIGTTFTIRLSMENDAVTQGVEVYEKENTLCR